MSNNIKKTRTITGIIKDLTFSDTDVWLWVRIPASEYEFRDYSAREQLARDFDLSLSNLLSSDEKAMEFHLIVSSRPFKSREWIQNLYTVNEQNTPNPEFKYFLSDMYDHVEGFNFREKIVFLGINLGHRQEFSPVRKVTAFGDSSFGKMLNSFGGIVDQNVTENEFEYWNTRAKSLRSSLANSRIKGAEATTTDIAYIIRKNFYPAMPAPSPETLSIGDSEKWGSGEIGVLMDAEMDNSPRWLKITQLINGKEVSGYRATLCFSKFPVVISYPEKSPWMHYASHLAFPVDLYSRFTLEPTRKVRKEVDRKLKEAKDQADNQQSSGGTASMQVQEQIQLGTELEFVLGKNTEPWVYGRHRIVVEAETVEELKERAQNVIDHYKGLDILVQWPTGDQLNLLKESLPSDKVRLQSYWQRQELSIISAGVPAGAGSTGDTIEYLPTGKHLGWLGPYIGYTTGNTQEPVFLSAHSSIARNRPPGITITGEPGSGKTFCAFTLTYQMALSGVWTIYIDPKADALALKNLPGMGEGNCQVLNLKDGNDGMLDPFSMSDDKGERLELALETIGLMIGGTDTLSSSEFNELAKAINLISENDNPSLDKVVEYLVHNTNPDAESLGQKLNFIRQLPYSRLCFSAKTQDTLRVDRGLTIITLLGLDLPGADTPPKAYSNPNRLAVAVMFLLTSFTRKLMLSANKRQAKAIIVDEAWAVTSTAQGSKLVNEVARMGRSHNTGMILISQNASDFMGGGVTNSVSTKIAFKSTETNEVKNVLNYLGLDNDEGNQQVVASLNRGECLIKDASNIPRTARVKIENWNPVMNGEFETNPTLRAQV